MYAKDGAIRTGDSKCIKLLVERGADLTHRDHAGRTTLEYAEEQGSEKIINELKDILKNETN